jgi:hypothetical protein
VVQEFSILSLNTFGVPFYLSRGRLVRLASILSRYENTVVCLQEVQQNAYVPLLSRHLKGYTYQAVYPHVYAPKGGLGTYSKEPLSRIRFVPYTDRGLRLLVTFSDWALYKGILVTRVRMGPARIWILNTHMNANYTGVWSRSNLLARVQKSQVRQLINLIKTLPGQDYLIVCGDLNFPRSAYLYDELITGAGLRDPLKTDPRPTYRRFPLTPAKWNMTLDYLLVRTPPGKDPVLEADLLDLEDESQKNPMRRFLTDHRALVLRIKPRVEAGI